MDELQRVVKAFLEIGALSDAREMCLWSLPGETDNRVLWDLIAEVEEAYVQSDLGSKLMAGMDDASKDIPVNGIPQTLEEVLSLDEPADPYSWMPVRLLQVERLFQAGRLEDAGRICQHALEETPRHPEFWAWVAEIAFTDGNDSYGRSALEAAIGSLRWIRKVTYKRTYLDAREANFLLSLNRAAEALPLLQEVVKTAPREPSVLALLSVALGELGLMDDSLESLHRVLATARWDSSILSWCLGRLMEIETAKGPLIPWLESERRSGQPDRGLTRHLLEDFQGDLNPEDGPMTVGHVGLESRSWGEIFKLPESPEETEWLDYFESNRWGGWDESTRRRLKRMHRSELRATSAEELAAGYRRWLLHGKKGERILSLRVRKWLRPPLQIEWAP